VKAASISSELQLPQSFCLCCWGASSCKGREKRLQLCQRCTLQDCRATRGGLSVIRHSHDRMSVQAHGNSSSRSSRISSIQRLQHCQRSTLQGWHTEDDGMS
jgi:hypothetical protein